MWESSSECEYKIYRNVAAKRAVGCKEGGGSAEECGLAPNMNASESEWEMQHRPGDVGITVPQHRNRLRDESARIDCHPMSELGQ